MGISGYTSSIILNKLKHNKSFDLQQNNGIIPLFNDVFSLEELVEEYRECLTIDKIKVTNEGFVFDILQEVNHLIKHRQLYFDMEFYRESKITVKNSKRVGVRRENIDIQHFKEAYVIFFNKLIRNIHTNKIVFINIKLKAKNNTSLEQNIVKNYNDLLDKYFNIIKEISPGIKIINLNCCINIVDRKIKYEMSECIEFEIINAINEKCIFQNEKIYPAVYPIKYYFEKATFFNKDKLIIVFSAFSANEAKYNYINTLKLVDCNKLFILDNYGTKGSYYLGLNGDFNIETSVISLITYIMSTNNICFKDIIAIGSSKGGTAALYYGIKYNFGNVIVGAPQYKVGTYLIDLSIKKYAKEIFGKVNPVNRLKYDNLIRLSANKDKITKIDILTSEGDRQYKKVLKEIEVVDEELGLNIDIEKCDIKGHSEIANVYPDFLMRELKNILENGCLENNLSNKIFRKIKLIKNKS